MNAKIPVLQFFGVFYECGDSDRNNAVNIIQNLYSFSETKISVAFE